ncbi:MAG: LEA type 2 family protein [Planctomycetes bacterium]|nr:LEA type 2 family protein [Planctomycetota bacterium]
MTIEKAPKPRRFLIALALLLVGQAVGCSTTRQPEVRAVNVAITRIDFNGVEAVFNVDVYNPHPIRLKIPKLQYQIDVAGTEFIRDEQSPDVDLPGGGVGTLPLPVQIDYARLRETFDRLEDASEIPYRLHGAAVVTGLDHPRDVTLEHKGKLPILCLPSFSSPRVRFADASLTSAKVALEVDVHNPNVCGLGLADVSYSLSFGPIMVGHVRASALGNLAPRSSGKLSLVGEITGVGILQQLARGEKLGGFVMAWSGTVQTPYGSVTLPPGQLGSE